MPLPLLIVAPFIAPLYDVLKKLCQCLCNRQYNCVEDIRKQVSKLKREEKFLLDKETEIKEDLEKSKIKMKMTPACATWLSKVKETTDKIETLTTKYQKTSKFCCGVCSVLDLRELDGEIVDMMTEVSDLMSTIRSTKIMCEKPPPPFIQKHAEKIEGFPSLHDHVRELQEHLGSEQLKRICLWGPVGAGKTTIMENVHDAVGKSGKFDIIFWISVRDQNTRDHIQEEILKRLNNLNAGDTNDEKANTISELLSAKSYVLFLDQVHSEIDLRNIGIHDDHSRGKVVFACRDKRICGKTDEEINVKGLSDEDSRKLFWQIVGGHLKNNGEINILARQIISECGGMPRLIKSIGTSLVNKNDPAAWRHMLYDLKHPSHEQKQNWEEVYRILKRKCQELHENDRFCFLYLAIFPADYELHKDYITECWRAEGYFQRFTNLREARDSGQVILNNFVEQSLLEKGIKAAEYKMFKQFRQAACRVAKDYDENSCIHDGEMNGIVEWERVTRISQICNGSPPNLPKNPMCHQLKTMLLQRSGWSEFPTSFFMHMSALRLLDLHSTQIRFLPSSISSLINLKALFLNKCNQLVALPLELESLSRLEILDMRSTGIHWLPVQITQLTGLKCLKVSFPENICNHNGSNHIGSDQCSTLKIRNLRSLEELSIDVNPTNQEWGQIAGKIASEVADLKELTTLCFYFPTVECLHEFFNNRRLAEHGTFRSFSIHVGYHKRNNPNRFDTSGCSAEKLLRFCGGQGFPDGISRILKEACSLELIGHRNAANLSRFGADSLANLEACIIEECPEMTSIIEGDDQGGSAFQCLNKLHLYSLPKLERIWSGPMTSRSFCMLTTLSLTKCDSVRTLFSLEMILRLNQLYYLQVESCKLIESIVEPGTIFEPGAFPKLKDLELIHLPKLTDIWEDASVEWNSLESIKADSCVQLSNFPSSFQKAAKLRVIHYTEGLWNQLVWPNEPRPNEPPLRDRFQRLHKPL